MPRPRVCSATRALLQAALLGVASIVGGSCWRADRANVVLISIDCLNQRQFETALAQGHAPQLSRLKAQATAFSRAYAHAPWTTPSHMSMLTGLYPSQHGRDIPYGLMIDTNEYYSRAPTFSTLADRLRSAGYETAAFVGRGSISATYGLSQGFDTYREHRKDGALSDLSASAEAVERWLRGREGRPFFLFFHTYDLHGPRPKGFESDASAIAYIDAHVGRVLTALASAGAYDRSLVILTGDHGSNMVETAGKCCVHGAGHYEENLRVPLLLKLPGRDEGRLDTRLARHVDLLPTAMTLLGLASSYAGPGVSLLGRPAPAGDEPVSFSEADGRCAVRRALVSERYKYIYTPRDEVQAALQGHPRFYDDTCPRSCRDLPVEELYDLAADPHERRNLAAAAGSPELDAVLERFRREMGRHLNLPPHYTRGVVAKPRVPDDAADAEDLRESLRALGYVR